MVLAQRIGRYALFAFLALAAVRGVYGFCTELTVQLSAPLGSDMKIFFAVGRGIVNGLNPYAEVFDSKPPGIFVLAASSLWISGDQIFANIIQTITIVAMWGMLVLLGWKEGASSSMRRVILLASAFFGLALTQYAAVRSGYLQTESFGAAAGIAYVYLLARYPRFRIAQIFLATLCVTIAVAFKEPFAPILIVCALLLSPNIRHFIRSCVFPLVLAGVLGVLVLGILGWLPVIWNLYLPEMFFGTYIIAPGAPWVQGIDLPKIGRDLWDFSPFFLPVIAMLTVMPILSAAPEKKRGRVLISSIIIVSSPLLISVFFLAAAAWEGMPFDVRSLIRLPLTQVSWFSGLMMTLLIGAGLVSAAGMEFLRRTAKMQWKGIVMTLIRLAFALFITSAVVGLRGKYYPHHFALAVPVYVALFVLFIRGALLMPSRNAKIFLWSLTVFSAGVLLCIPLRQPRFAAIFTGDASEQEHRAMATKLDALMDACGYERFLAYGWETENLWGHTKHSPYGSSFTHMTWSLDRVSPRFMPIYERRITRETPIIVTDDRRLLELERERGAWLWKNFTKTPPACAKEFLPVGYFNVLFRK